MNGESTLNYGSYVLSFNGTASVLSGTGNTFGGYLYRDGGSGYFYIDALTTSSYTCGFKIRGYQNGTYTEHLQGFAGTTKIGSGGSSDSTVTTSISPMRLDNYANLRLTGTYNTSLDGEVVQFRDITTDRLKTNLALPTEITES